MNETKPGSTGRGRFVRVRWGGDGKADDECMLDGMREEDNAASVDSSAAELGPCRWIRAQTGMMGRRPLEGL